MNVLRDLRTSGSTALHASPRVARVRRVATPLPCSCAILAKEALTAMTRTRPVSESRQRIRTQHQRATAHTQSP